MRKFILIFLIAIPARGISSSPLNSNDSLAQAMYRSNLNIDYDTAYSAGLAVSCGFRSDVWGSLVMGEVEKIAVRKAAAIWSSVSETKEMSDRAIKGLDQQYEVASQKSIDPQDCEAMQGSPVTAEMDMLFQDMINSSN